MSKSEKAWLITAASLILIGIILFGGVMTVLRWDFKKLSTSQYEANNYEINEGYQNISINSNTADIVFVSSEDSKHSVECLEHKNVKHSVAVKDGTLVIELVDSRKWYENIGINFGKLKITVRIPHDEYGNLYINSSTSAVEIPRDFSFSSIDISNSTGDVTNYASAQESVKIKTSTGNIHIEGISAGSLDLSVSTGKIFASDIVCAGDVAINVSTGKTYLTNVKCESVTSKGNTGNISLKKVVATGIFSIERTTGDVSFDGSDAAEIFVETDTGNVVGTLLSEKVFITNTDTGKKEVPETSGGGRCKITTSTGNIRINVAK